MIRSVRSLLIPRLPHAQAAAPSEPTPSPEAQGDSAAPGPLSATGAVPPAPPPSAGPRPPTPQQAVSPPPLPPPFAAQLEAACAAGEAALQALPLAPLLAERDGGNLRLLLNRLSTQALHFQSDGPQARTWTAIFPLLGGWASTQHRDLLAPLMPLLIKHPQKDQRETLMQLTVSGARLTACAEPLSRVVDAHLQGTARPPVTLARLALLGAGLGHGALHARVDRLLKSKPLRDSLRMHEVLGSLLALAGQPAVLQAILHYPTPPQLRGQLTAMGHPLASQCRDDADLLTGHQHKDAVNAYYNSQVLPALLGYLTVSAALVAAGQSPLEAGVLRPLEDLKQGLARALLGTEAAGDVVAALPQTLATWRNPQLLHTYAGRLRAANGPRARAHDYARALTEVLTHVVRGDYTTWRTVQSAQMQRLRTLTPDFDVHAWNRGAQVSLGTVARWTGQATWTLEDTGHANDLLNSASEGARSCQRVDGSPENNGTLVGRLGDGSKRMLAIKDARGAIKARAMLRLMQVEGSRPCLLLSRPYEDRSLVPDAVAIRAVFADFAKARAAALGVEAVHTYNGGTLWYPWQGEARTARSEASWKPDYWDECDDAHDMTIDGVRDGAVEFPVWSLA